ncbi:MAG: hypothetical protein HW380_1620 [Magnetococcales bacterium]|nr:hypothetical protein [Magnetococcales bacterium]
MDWGRFFDNFLRKLVQAQINGLLKDAQTVGNHPGRYGVAKWEFLLKENALDDIKSIFLTVIDKTVAYMAGQSNPLKNIRPDRHRLSAALMVAVLQSRPFSVSYNADARLSLSMRNPNEVLAYIVAEKFLIGQIVNSARKGGMAGMTICSFFDQGKGLIGPDLNPSPGQLLKYLGGQYIKHVVYTLIHAQRDESLNVFFIAHLLFWLEWNTLQSVGNQ